MNYKFPGKLYTHGALSSILKDLSDDILPADGDEIYNPFTPVVSPTDDQPTRINKMFIQTSTGYRPVDHCFYKNSITGDIESNRYFYFIFIKKKYFLITFFLFPEST